MEQELTAHQVLQEVLAHQFQSQELQQIMQVAVAVEAGSALQVEVPAVLEEAVLAAVTALDSNTGKLIHDEAIARAQLTGSRNKAYQLNPHYPPDLEAQWRTAWLAATSDASPAGVVVDWGSEAGDLLAEQYTPLVSRRAREALLARCVWAGRARQRGTKEAGCRDRWFGSVRVSGSAKRGALC